MTRHRKIVVAWLNLATGTKVRDDFRRVNTRALVEILHAHAGRIWKSASTTINFLKNRLDGVRAVDIFGKFSLILTDSCNIRNARTAGESLANNFNKRRNLDINKIRIKHIFFR